MFNVIFFRSTFLLICASVLDISFWFINLRYTEQLVGSVFKYCGLLKPWQILLSALMKLVR